jgi:light-harvesting complex 1 alpha chain
MWRIWLMFDPRQGVVAIAAFVFIMVMTNHFVQLSTPRYGSWLNEGAAMSPASAQYESRAAESRIAQAH